MAQLHVYKNDVIDCIVAESAEDARAIGLSYAGNSEEYRDLEYSQLPDDQLKTIDWDDGGEAGKITMTCAEWCAKNGKGFLCSTEY